MNTVEYMDNVMPAGSLLIIETGEYSDSSWHGPVRLLKSFSRNEAARAYIAGWSAYRAEANRKSGFQEFGDDDGPDSGAFIDWLIHVGWAEMADAESWHVGSYGRFQP